MGPAAPGSHRYRSHFLKEEEEEVRVRPHHTVQSRDRPGLWLKLAPEEFAEVAVVVQVLHGSLLHVHPKGPDVQAVNRPAQPVRQLHLIEATPGP